MAAKNAPGAAPEQKEPPALVTCDVLDVLKHDGVKYGPAGNAAGWPDQVQLAPEQAARLAAAGVVAAPAAAPAEQSAG